MAGTTRFTTGRMSRVVGTPTTIQANFFGFDALQGITGEDLLPLLSEAMGIPYEELLREWPIITGASIETARVETVEVGPKHARVALTIGGPQLVEDARNRSKKDYTPYVEFNGTSKTPPGTMARAMIANDTAVRDAVKAGIRELLRSRLSGG